jgi:hypothetical protein
MSATTAFQPVPAHQLRATPGTAVPETRLKNGTSTNLSGAVEAQLSFFDPPKDGAKVQIPTSALH